MEHVHIKRILLALWDCFLCAASFACSVILTSAAWRTIEGILSLQEWRYMPAIIAIHLALFMAGGAYRVLWSVSSVSDAIRLILLEVASCAVMLAGSALLDWNLSRSGLVLTAALTILTALASRFLWQLLRSGRLQPRSRTTKSVMVIGAGEAGAYVINRLLSDTGYHSKSIVLVDDDSEKLGAKIQNVPVRGVSKDIPDLVVQYGVQEILIAIPSLKGKAYADLISICNETGCRIRVLSTTLGDANSETAPGAAHPSLQFREINPSDFLSREEVKLNIAGISGYLANKTVLVTGGGGSIGSELCRQVMRFSPEALYIRPLAKLRLQLKIANTRNEIESQGKAFSPISIAFG